MLLLQINVISAAMSGAASFSNHGPILSVPVALLISIFDKYFNTSFLSMLGILNFVSVDILLLQNSLSLS